VIVTKPQSASEGWGAAGGGHSCRAWVSGGAWPPVRAAQGSNRFPRAATASGLGGLEWAASGRHRRCRFCSMVASRPAMPAPWFQPQISELRVRRGRGRPLSTFQPGHADGRAGQVPGRFDLPARSGGRTPYQPITARSPSTQAVTTTTVWMFYVPVGWTPGTSGISAFGVRRLPSSTSRTWPRRTDDRAVSAR